MSLWLLKLSRISGGGGGEGVKRGITIECQKSKKGLNFGVEFRVIGVIGLVRL